MTKFQVAYVPVGVPTFHLESAQKEFEKSIDLLNTITDAAIVPDKMLLSIQDLTNFLDTIEPSLIILQNITFANAAYASEVLKRFSCPRAGYRWRPVEIKFIDGSIFGRKCFGCV